METKKSNPSFLIAGVLFAWFAIDILTNIFTPYYFIYYLTPDVILNFIGFTLLAITFLVKPSDIVIRAGFGLLALASLMLIFLAFEYISPILIIIANILLIIAYVLLVIPCGKSQEISFSKLSISTKVLSIVLLIAGQALPCYTIFQLGLSFTSILTSLFYTIIKLVAIILVILASKSVKN